MLRKKLAGGISGGIKVPVAPSVIGGGGAGVDNVLLEDGVSNVLLEDGSSLLLME
jgi:hypothetical protein